MTIHAAAHATSARADELDKFNRLADRWWDEEGPFAALHAINPLRMAFIAEHAVIEDMRVLDVGCGGGILSEALSLAGAEVTALDLAADALSAAQRHAHEHDLAIDYRLADVIEFAEEHPGRFDCITCMEMLEHVDDPAQIVQALATVVKPGGWVFLSTLNRNPKSWLFGIAAAEYLLKLVPPGTHEHKRFIKPAELTAMARRARLAPRTLCGITYNPLTKNYALNPRDLDVNYLLACQKND